jgi:eukaryotic-like serine/threonine-protein kinase
MPVLHCPNGHSWQVPAGPPSAHPDDVPLCPVCGVPAETLTHPGLATPATGLERFAQGAAPAVAAALAAAAPPRSAPPVETEQPPPRIAGYEILEELGQGGMGIVYKARQLATDRLVALKVIRKERLSNPESVRRFRREAQAAARLAHPNVVLVYDSDQAGDVHFLAMEYVAGVTLQRLVEQGGPLPVPVACDYLRQIAMGLQHAHEQALVHRDVKPANLMITSPGPGAKALVKILDMGVARLYQLSDRNEDVYTTLTQDGAMLGTPDYMAPEQLEDAHAADIRADLYSLGCTGYFLLTGQVPFPGGTLLQKLDKQRWGTPASVEQLRPEVPSGLAALIRKLLAKKPADRCQTPGELLAGLEEVMRTGRFGTEPARAAVRPVQQLTGHTDAVTCLAFAPDGRRLISGGKDRSLRLWDVAAGHELRHVAEMPQEVRGVAFLPDGRHVVAACGAGARLWELETGREVVRFIGHTDTIKSLAVSPDGTWLLTGGDDKALRLWDVHTGREVRRLPGHTRDVTSVAFCCDGRLALSGSRDQTLRLWDVTTGRELRRFTGPKGMVVSVALSADGRYALSGNFDTTLRLFDVASGRELRRFSGHKQMVAAVAFAADGRRVLSGSHDRTVRLWELESARELCCCEGHTGPVTCVSFAPDGRRAVSGGADRAICLWDLPA